MAIRILWSAFGSKPINLSSSYEYFLSFRLIRSSSLEILRKESYLLVVQNTIQLGNNIYFEFKIILENVNKLGYVPTNLKESIKTASLKALKNKSSYHSNLLF